MKSELLNIASMLEDIQRDLSYLDPEDFEDDAPELIDQINAAIMSLAAIAEKLTD